MNEVLLAGAAAMDITPPMGSQLCGDLGRRRPASKLLYPLQARAAVFQTAGRKLCIVALDVTIVNRPYTAAIRQGARELGFEAGAVMVHATQTHSAPSIGGILLQDYPLPSEWEWLRLHDGPYSDFAVAQAVEAIRLAQEALQPVQIGVRSGIEGRVAFNRRGVQRDGQVMMPANFWPEPLGWTQISYLEGPIDPEVGVLAARDHAGGLITALLNYTCHPVYHFTSPELFVSADWPGAWRESFRSNAGEGCTPVVLNGACGNINPWDPFDPDYRDDCARGGTRLAEVARKVVEGLEWQEVAALDSRMAEIKLPLREVPPGELEQARDWLERHPLSSFETSTDGQNEASFEWMIKAGTVNRHLERERNAKMNYEVQVLRIGDTAFIGWPGEPFAESGLRLKLLSPARHTYIVHCTSHYVGYIPTPDAFPRGGHEVTWSKLEPDACDIIEARTLEMLHELFDKSSSHSS